MSGELASEREVRALLGEHLSEEGIERVLTRASALNLPPLEYVAQAALDTAMLAPLAHPFDGMLRLLAYTLPVLRCVRIGQAAERAGWPPARYVAEAALFVAEMDLEAAESGERSVSVLEGQKTLRDERMAEAALVTPLDVVKAREARQALEAEGKDPASAITPLEAMRERVAQDTPSADAASWEERFEKLENRYSRAVTNLVDKFYAPLRSEVEDEKKRVETANSRIAALEAAGKEDAADASVLDRLKERLTTLEEHAVREGQLTELHDRLNERIEPLQRAAERHDPAALAERISALEEATRQWGDETADRTPQPRRRKRAPDGQAGESSARARRCA